MATATATETASAGGPFAPLAEPVFRRIWTASVLANFGQMILGVGAAWEMTRLTSSPGMVALVQTAMMLPLVLVALPAGAVADMFDRRRIAIAGLAFSVASAALLAALAWAGLTTPWLLLGFCALIGAGVAFYSPAWQASIGEQVEPARLPAAIALGTISHNAARSVGPAIGGLIVLAAGAKAAFATNALCYLPLLLAFVLWRRRHVPSRLPPERLAQAIVTGTRYALHASAIRIVLVRIFLFGMAGATAAALAPLIAKDLLGGDASTYGLLLGASGVGAVAGALIVSPVRERFGTEAATRVMLLVGGAALVAVGVSRSIPLSCVAMLVMGVANILVIALSNVAVQLSAPRWVTARALSLFSSALTAGIALGAWGWGAVAGAWSIEGAILASGAVMVALPLVGLWLPLPDVSHASLDPVEIGQEPEVALALTLRSGPIAIEVEYRVDPDQAREFYDAMRALQRVRRRNGAIGWSLARDIADSAQWTERFQCATWGDYLRLRDRFTEADLAVQAQVDRFVAGDSPRRVRRWLERPFGSVRWRADSPDPKRDDIGLLAP